MKKLLWTIGLFSLFTITTICGQTSHGDAMAGGGLRLFFPKNSDNFTMEFNPRIGFFVANNVAIGGILPVTINRTGNTRISSIGLKPFGRFYLGGSQLKLFLEGRFGLEHFTARDVPTDRRINQYDDLSVGFGAGLAAFLNKHVALEPQVSYDVYNRNTAQYAGVTVSVALQVYFP
ncbi:hypothetical protein QNI16_29045 [Cytophagaceae bacterium YF14B1]|uniref:Outer membrane protein beta-barrel domain-containing protein n=1 Tax=Xanthocytophaga flava TaxID=3048013 RepID=A0AAE3QTE1_9BACT|nr:hypothetical protein [Xanthocytophaga flavus]MDJ1484581.1 hypothetical protein [Xanthocytophaga flavus]